MTTVLEALKAAEQRLKEVPDPRLDAEWLFSEVLGVSRLEMLLDKRRELTEAEAAAFEALLARREAREPLQYILGTQSFMGFSMKTDSRALIPRNDTEALCEEALKYVRPGCRVLDLCTGSGALAAAIKKLCPGAEVVASDISEAALSLAKENAAALNADIRFMQGDLFSPVAGEKFDVIVSNPPYIPEGLRGCLQAEVEREPALALFAGDDGLDFYRRIAREAPAHLLPGGRLCIEIGDGQGDAVKALLYEEFTDIQVLNDLNGLPRVVSAAIKEEKRL
ncbi:MAG: peptide chain release factor N(5)-glutamine methyltransferase [Clostridia bacterium]|nr:peptide chain release factor N(5)-glutamine methyltransferase [Clostridia bacterium]